MRSPAPWGVRPRRSPVFVILVGGLLMVLGTALGVAPIVYYALAFPAFGPASPWLALATIVGVIGRVMYIVGFALAVLGCVRALEFSRIRTGSSAASVPDEPAAAAPFPPVVQDPRGAATPFILIGLALFILGEALSLGAPYILALFPTAQGLQLEFAGYVAAALIGSPGLPLIFYGIGTFLVRRR